jgi:hypothetical protein
MRERGVSFKAALNEAARKGLTGEKRTRARRFVQTTFHLGQAQDLRWDKALAIAETMEDEELTRKLALNK